MAFVRKLLKRPKKDRDSLSVQSVSSRDSREHDELLEEILEDSSDRSQTGGFTTPSSTPSKSGSKLEIERDYDETKKELNRKFSQFRRKEAGIERRQREVMLMDAEIKELSRMLSLCTMQTSVLDEETKNKRLEVSSMCKLIPPDFENEIRKKEPMYYKKYKNLQNTIEAKNLLTMIRQRGKALQYLEILAFRRILDFEHLSTNSESKIRRRFTAVKDNSNNFDEALKSVRSRLEHKPKSRKRMELTPAKIGLDNPAFDLDDVPQHPLATVQTSV